MSRLLQVLILALALATLQASVLQAQPDGPSQAPLLVAGASPAPEPPIDATTAERYQKVVRDTANMVSDGVAQGLVAKLGLQILNLTWEDTGRYKGSSVGPNISDVTLQVQETDPRTKAYRLTCLPVIRFPNFSDRTADIAPEQFYLLVGNEKGQKVRRISLREYLGDLRTYLNKPSSWKGKRGSLLAARDTHVLVSAQACFLPVPAKGRAEFNPVIFNYQSMAGDPAVLTILATREGTSATIIDNQRDGFSAGSTWGQRLFFNQAGMRASLTGTRLSDFQAGGGDPGQVPSAEAGTAKGLNMVLLIQVPLKQKNPMRFSPNFECSSAPPAPGGCKSRGGSDVEDAVIGHGKVEGPYTEIADLDIERDDRFPVRVTVQFYKATSNGVVSEKDVADVRDQIEKVYQQSDYVGSLVTGGETGRPTEYTGSKQQPADWWRVFWQRHQQNTGQTREEALEMLVRLLGLSSRESWW